MGHFEVLVDKESQNLKGSLLYSVFLIAFRLYSTLKPESKVIFSLLRLYLMGGSRMIMDIKALKL